MTTNGEEVKKMVKRLLATLFAATLLMVGAPTAASAEPGEEICKVDLLGWEPC